MIPPRPRPSLRYRSGEIRFNIRIGLLNEGGSLTYPGGIEMAAQMFAAIRRGKLKPGMADEFAKRVKAGALPVMKEMDGFKAYYLVVGADDTVVAVSLFTNKTVAEGSTLKLMPWIKENLGPLLASPTEATDGEVVICEAG
jgi:hypothetical protein